MKFSKSLSLVVFVVLTAFVYSQLQKNQSEGSVDLASNGFFSFLDQINHANKSVKNMNPNLSGDMACDCQFGDDQNVLKFENTRECGKDPGRLDVQNKLEQYSTLPAFARYLKYDSHSVGSSDIPRKCVLYIVRYMESNNAVKPYSYGLCENESGYPQRGIGKPCMTEEYVNLAYNSFVDVTNCLGLEQKHLVPKIMNESGFIFNSWAHLRVKELKYNSDHVLEKTTIQDPPAKQEDVFDIIAKANQENLERKAKGLPIEKELGLFGGDAGMGQLTAAALSDANEYLKTTLNEIKNKGQKGNLSCQRVADFVADTQVKSELNTRLDSRCEVVALPENPVKSLVIMGIINRNNHRYVEDKWKAENIDSLMDQAGMRSFNKKQIQEALTLLAYNAGAGTAVILFKNWLKMRIENINRYPIRASDFSFDEKSDLKYKDKSIISMMPQEANQLRGKMKELDHLDFGTFMMIYREQNRWARGYLYSVREVEQSLEQKMGKGTCTDSSFLSQ